MTNKTVTRAATLRAGRISIPRRYNAISFQRYEKRLERFTTEMFQEQYRNLAGLKTTLNLRPIYTHNQSLFSREAIRAIAEADADPKMKRYVLQYAAARHIDNRSLITEERIAAAETQATIEHEKKIIPYRAVPAIIANEPIASRRHALFELYASKTAEDNPKRMEHFTQLNDNARQMGFRDYVEMNNVLGRLELDELTARMRSLLDQTREVYFSQLRKYLERLGVPEGQARACDMFVLSRASQYDAAFSGEGVQPALHSLLSGLGIDVNQPNIKYDLEDRPLKSPRSFCAPIRIPQQIVLVLSPRGGFNDYRAALHELGHAQHFTHVNSDLPFAYKLCGDYSVTEAYAFLFDNLLSNRGWLDKRFDIPYPNEYFKTINFIKLYLLRRLAVKLLYEQELYSHTDILKMRSRYAEYFGEHLGLLFDEREFLADVDKGFYCICYLRALAFEVQLRQSLEEKYGREWFNDVRAGEYLRTLWGFGMEYDVNELAQKLGQSGIDFNPLVEEITKELTP